MKDRRAGSALIEFAGSLIVVSAMFTGIFQFSYAISTYHALVNAVRAGARYASLQPQPSSNANAEFTKAVQNVVVYGDPAPPANAKPVALGLTPDNVELILQPGTATVSVRGFEVDSIFSKIKLDGRPTVTFPLTRPSPLGDASK
jgi:Flp pilus assembly protein TadG